MKVIKDMTSLFEEYLPLEEKKLQAAQEKDVRALEDCMTQEQALTLKVRGLEQQREKVQAQYGWDGMTFRQIIDKQTDGKQREYLDAFDALSRALRAFKSANESALTVVNLNLRGIQNATNQTGYGRDGAPFTTEKHLTNTRA